VRPDRQNQDDDDQNQQHSILLHPLAELHEPSTFAPDGASHTACRHVARADEKAFDALLASDLRPVIAIAQQSRRAHGHNRRERRVVGNNIRRAASTADVRDRAMP
jgi:hypothetical protein